MNLLPVFRYNPGGSEYFWCKESILFD